VLRLAPFGLRPVLALTHPGAAPAGSRSRVQRLGTRFAGVVELPHVPRWQVLGDSCAEAAELLGTESEQLEPAVAAYTEALRRLVAVVLAGGQLAEPVPPVLIRAVGAGPDPPIRVHRPDELDPAPGDLLAGLVAARHPALSAG
jgi:hypothetical protein